jgi:multicomponent Na+:H+ antiporter subunit E
MSDPTPPTGRHPIASHPRLALLQFLALFGFWMLLSWRLDPLYLAIGLASAAGLTLWTQRLTATIVHADRPSPGWLRVPVLAWRMVAYVAWILWSMIKAGVQIARIVLTPGLNIDPQELRFRTGLRSPMARTVFANSITLVPGTLTVDIEGEWVLVHALYPEAADDIISGKLQNRVARLFDEGDQPMIDPGWRVDTSLPTSVDPDPSDSSLHNQAETRHPAHPDEWGDGQ